jgi:transposase-like protein
MSAIFNNTNGSKNYYTREIDEKLIAMLNEGKSRQAIEAAIGHSENSITFRKRFLMAAERKAAEKGIVIKTVADLLDTIEYKA